MPKENVYRSVFVTQLNLSFFVPKKDQCMVCSKYQSGTAEKKEAAELDFVEHLHQKRYCSSCEESEYSLIRLLSLQLLTCKVFFSCRLVQKAYCTVYYKRKLVVHNRTIYEAAAPNKGYCYLWPENAGKKRIS